jgi:hypothetical protein
MTVQPLNPPDDPTNSARAAEHRASMVRRAAYQKALRLSLSGRRDLAQGLRQRMPTMDVITRDDPEG